MPKFSECDWDDGTVFKVLQDRSFFPYSGEDGDLFRKNGLAGWRVSVYGRDLVRIQKKGRKWRGHQYWNEKVRWEAEDELSEAAIEQFASVLDHLIETGELPD